MVTTGDSADGMTGYILVVSFVTMACVCAIVELQSLLVRKAIFAKRAGYQFAIAETGSSFLNATPAVFT